MPQKTDKDWESLTTKEQSEWEEKIQYLIERGYLSPKIDIKEYAAKMYEKTEA